MEKIKILYSKTHCETVYFWLRKLIYMSNLEIQNLLKAFWMFEYLMLFGLLNQSCCINPDYAYLKWKLRTSFKGKDFSISFLLCVVCMHYVLLCFGGEGAVDFRTTCSLALSGTYTQQWCPKRKACLALLLSSLGWETAVNNTNRKAKSFSPFPVKYLEA